jgi:hypothetical protein
MFCLLFAYGCPLFLNKLFIALKLHRVLYDFLCELIDLLEVVFGIFKLFDLRVNYVSGHDHFQEFERLEAVLVKVLIQLDPGLDALEPLSALLQSHESHGLLLVDFEVLKAFLSLVHLLEQGLHALKGLKGRNGLLDLEKHIDHLVQLLDVVF